MLRRLLALIAGAALLAPVAAAQQTEYRLDGGEWVRADAPEPGTDEALIARARELIASERPGRARDLLNRWIDEHERTDNPWLPQAYLLRGDAKTAEGDEYKALFDYETVVREFPGSAEFVRALERELEIAVRYVNGLRRRLWGLRIVGAAGEGEELLMRVQERLPGSRLAERAAIELADYYFRKRDLKQAAVMYDIFLENYPESRYRKHAMQRRIFANVARAKGPHHDASGLLDAQVLIREYVRQYPADAERTGIGDALAARIDDSAARQLLETARWYLRHGDPISARYTLRRLVQQHPRTVAAEEALDIMAEHGWTLRPRERAPTAVPAPEAPAPGEAAADIAPRQTPPDQTAPGRAASSDAAVPAEDRR